MAQGRGLESGVELVGLGVDPALVHLGDAVAAAQEEPAGAALLGEEARVADGDDRCVGGAGADVGHDRLIAVDTVARGLAGQGVDGAVDRTGHLRVTAAAGRREETPVSTADAVAEDPGEAGVVAPDGEGDQAGVGAEAVELGGLSPGLVGLVEVVGSGPGAGAHLQGPPGPLAHDVRVGSRRAPTGIAARDIGTLCVGRHSEARGVGVTQSHVGALRQAAEVGWVEMHCGRRLARAEQNRDDREQHQPHGRAAPTAWAVVGRVGRAGLVVGLRRGAGGGQMTLLGLWLSVESTTTRQRDQVGVSGNGWIRRRCTDGRALPFHRRILHRRRGSGASVKNLSMLGLESGC